MFGLQAVAVARDSRNTYSEDWLKSVAQELRLEP